MLVLIKYLLIFLMTASIFWIYYKAIKRGRFLRTFLFSAFLGIVSLLTVWGIGKLTTPTLELNIWTFSCSGALSVPGVILMIITKILWGI